jgi:hypothetical protein
LVFFKNRPIDFEKLFKNEFLRKNWTKYEKYNNGQSWVLLYGTKGDVG